MSYLYGDVVSVKDKVWRRGETDGQNGKVLELEQDVKSGLWVCRVEWKDGTIELLPENQLTNIPPSDRGFGKGHNIEETRDNHIEEREKFKKEREKSIKASYRLGTLEEEKAHTVRIACMTAGQVVMDFLPEAEILDAGKGLVVLHKANQEIVLKFADDAIDEVAYFVEGEPVDKVAFGDYEPEQAIPWGEVAMLIGQGDTFNEIPVPYNLEFSFDNPNLDPRDVDFGYISSKVEEGVTSGDIYGDDGSIIGSWFLEV